MLSSQVRCLCGAVKIIGNNISPKFTVCHCDSCREGGSGPYFVMQCGSNVKIDGADKIRIYDSSPWASRGFCTECGTHLFFKFNESGDYNVSVGIFKHYYYFSNQSKEMTEAEIMAYFAKTL